MKNNFTHRIFAMVLIFSIVLSSPLTVAARISDYAQDAPVETVAETEFFAEAPAMPEIAPEQPMDNPTEEPFVMPMSESRTVTFVFMVDGVEIDRQQVLVGNYLLQPTNFWMPAGMNFLGWVVQADPYSAAYLPLNFGAPVASSYDHDILLMVEALLEEIPAAVETEWFAPEPIPTEPVVIESVVPAPIPTEDIPVVFIQPEPGETEVVPTEVASTEIVPTIIMPTEPVETPVPPAEETMPEKRALTFLFIVDDNIIASQMVNVGELLVRPEDPAAPEGKTFVGWKVQIAPGSDEYRMLDFTAPVAFEADVNVELRVIADFSSEAEPTETPVPTSAPQRSVSIASSAGDVVQADDIIVLTAALTGFDDVKTEVQWQFSSDETTWTDMAGANSIVYSFKAEPTKLNYSWRLKVTIVGDNDIR